MLQLPLSNGNATSIPLYHSLNVHSGLQRDDMYCRSRVWKRNSVIIICNITRTEVSAPSLGSRCISASTRDAGNLSTTMSRRCVGGKGRIRGFCLVGCVRHADGKATGPGEVGGNLQLYGGRHPLKGSTMGVDTQDDAGVGMLVERKVVVRGWGLGGGGGGEETLCRCPKHHHRFRIVHALQQVIACSRAGSSWQADGRLR